MHDSALDPPFCAGHSGLHLRPSQMYKARSMAAGFSTNRTVLSTHSTTACVSSSTTNIPLSESPGKGVANYIFAFEAENEVMIGKGQDYITAHQAWACNRSGTIKSELGSNSGVSFHHHQ
ncbi:hypothetical protein OF83DRAFT_424712 [Amylostereum chailletii]|nr:hypothetical protein OF83DRAFT_424712 [Amylostereum chailletii]